MIITLKISQRRFIRSCLTVTVCRSNKHPMRKYFLQEMSSAIFIKESTDLHMRDEQARAQFDEWRRKMETLFEHDDEGKKRGRKGVTLSPADDEVEQGSDELCEEGDDDEERKEDEKEAAPSPPQRDERFYLRRCRRFMPGRAEMLAEVDKVFAKYGRFDGLFLEDMDTTHNTLRNLLANGRTGDPAALNMYMYTHSADGIPHYITSRGTSQLENFWKVQASVVIFVHCE